MISNHHAMTYGHAYNWAILLGFTFAGGLIRIYFVQRHNGKASLFNLIGAGAILMAIAAAIAPKLAPPASSSLSQDSAAIFDSVQDVVSNRCTPCHAVAPTHVGFTSAPKGILFETPEHTQRQAEALYQQTVVTKAMPIGNLTGITDEERSVIAQWFESGAARE